MKTARLITALLAAALFFVACTADEPVPMRDGGSAPDTAPRPDAAVRADGATSPDAAVVADAAVDHGPAADAAASPDLPAPMPDAGVPDAAADRAPDTAAREDARPDAGPALALKLGAFALEGDLCPEGSAVVNTAPSAFTIVFSDATFAGQGPGTSLSRSCRVTMTIDVPRGYQFSGARFFAAGVALADQDQPGTMLLADRYTFEGQRDSASFSSDLSRRSEGSYIVARRPTDLWSPSCGASSRVRLLIDLTATVRGGLDLLALDTLDGAFTVPEGLLWRRCGETDPIRPPPSQKDQPCDGPNQLICAFGLICEFNGEVAELGSCIDPTEKVPPQAAGDGCGGYRDIPCADGLVCRFASPRSVEEKRLGFCTPALGNVDDTCGGVPAIPCAAGLTCFQENHKCVRDDGELGSRCGEGLRECKPGLFCNGSSCAVPRPRDGGADAAP